MYEIRKSDGTVEVLGRALLRSMRGSPFSSKAGVCLGRAWHLDHPFCPPAARNILHCPSNLSGGHYALLPHEKQILPTQSLPVWSWHLPVWEPRGAFNSPFFLPEAWELGRRQLGGSLLRNWVGLGELRSRSQAGPLPKNFI